MKPIHALGTLFDRLYSDRNVARLERATMVAACTGFFGHLALIALSRHVPEAPAIVQGVGTSYFGAIYTPFSFILFYEVLMLVKVLPQSITTAIGKQFEILSLVTVRNVFKDIAELGDIEGWTDQPEALRVLLYDMGGAVAMFALVACFYHMRRKGRAIGGADRLSSFIALKKSIGVLLTALFVVMASVSLIGWAMAEIRGAGSPDVPGVDLDLIFFPDFFKVMIFTDVLLLIASFAITNSYRYVFRNAGFVISTILLRVSITAPTYYDLGAALIGMVFGITILAGFNYTTYVESRQSRQDGDEVE